MTVPPLQQGDFVWCAFPEREAPLRPGPLHVGYTLAVAAVAGGHGVMVAYTTSQPWSGPLPPGVIAFDSEEAASLGQARAFVLDLRPGFRGQARQGLACSAARPRRCAIG